MVIFVKKHDIWALLAIFRPFWVKFGHFKAFWLHYGAKRRTSIWVNLRLVYVVFEGAKRRRPEGPAALRASGPACEARLVGAKRRRPEGPAALRA